MTDILNPSTPGVSVSPYPPELQAEASAIQRRRALADMLLLRSLQPIQQPTGWGGIPVPISPLAGLSHIAQAGLGAQAQTGLAGAESTLAGRYATGLSGAEQAVAEALKNKDYPAVAAAAGPWPALKSIAEKAREQMLPKFEVHGNALLDVNAPAPKATIQPVEEFTPSPQTVTTPQGSVTTPAQQSSVGGKLNYSPATTTLVSSAPVISGPKVGSEQYFKDAGEQVKKFGELAQNSMRLKGALNQLQEQDRGGIFSNVTTGPVTFLTNLAQASGLSLSPETKAKLGNTETFNAVANEAWQRLVSEFGGNRGVTASESETIKTIMPRAASSPAARQQLYQIVNNIANRNISNYHVSNEAYARAVTEESPNVWASAMKRVYLPGTQPLSPIAAPSAQPEQAPIPVSRLTPTQVKALQEWLNSQSRSPTAP